MERLARCVTWVIAGLLLAHLPSAPAQVTWTRAAVLEPRRTPVAYDSVRGRAVLFGGIESTYQAFSDTWEWDGRSWLRRFPATSPPARFGHALVYDSVRRRVVLFGGVSYSTLFSDTWEWDGDNWTQRSPATSPPARTLHALAFDSARGRVLLFGGSNSGTVFFSDTWEWDGVDWLPRSPGVSPPALAGPVMVDDSARSRVVLFGGQEPGRAVTSDTWEWDGNVWLRRSPANRPPPRWDHGLAYDPARRRVVLVGGWDLVSYRDLPGTWEWDGNDWMLRSPANSPTLRSGSALAYDTSRRRVLLFGGSVNDIRLPRLLFSDVWEWDGSDWVLRSPNTCPTPRSGHAIAYDRARRAVVLYGGGPSTNPLADTWIWDGERWEERFPANRPPPFHGHYLVTDSAKDVVLLVGATPSGAFSTWEWDGSDWLRRNSLASPGRSSHGLAFDSSRGRAVLFGGSSGESFFADTWEWDGSSWASRSSPPGPAARAGHALGYDSGRRRVILFGGWFTRHGGHMPVTTWFSDTWEWDGNNWVQRFPKTSPPEKEVYSVASDTARGRVVLVGSGTWEWDGSDWLRRSPPVSPPTPGGWSALAYDSARRRVVLFGGNTGSAATWEYGPVNPASFASFGGGCRGSAGTPVLEAATDQFPWTGNRLTLELRGLPPGSSALIWLGSSKTSWGSFRLPLDLGPAGMPGCALQVSADWFFPVFNFTGRGSADLDIPDDAALVGATFYNQGLVVDSRANAFGATVSNGGEGRIGAR